MTTGMAGDAQERLQETLQRPLVVTKPSGDMHSWLVPLTIKDRLVGYLLLSERLELISHTSLRRRPGSLVGTPRIVDWLEPKQVQKRAASIARPDEKLSVPVLTYDQYPDRLAWRVEACSSEGSIRQIMVAGDIAYEQEDLKDSVGSQGQKKQNRRRR